MERGEAPPDVAAPDQEYEALAAVVDGAVFRLDADHRLVDASDAFTEQTGCVVGEHPRLAALFGDDADRVERALDGLGAGEDATLTVADAAGGPTPCELRLSRVRPSGGVVGVLAPATDGYAHAPEERERVLREVYEVTTDFERSFEERLEALLSLVREAVGTEYASLSRTEGGEYSFELVDAAGAVPVEFGEQFSLRETNCARIVDTEEAVVFGDIATDAPGFVERAANAKLGLSCFLGAPVVVDGDVERTCCFLGTEPRARGFSEWEVTLVDLAAEWVGYELTQQRTRERLEQRNDALEASRRRYETLVENVPNGAVALVDEDLRYVTVGGSPLDVDDTTAADLEGRRVADVLSPELADVLVPLYRAALDGEANTVEREVGDRVIEFRVFPVDDDGAVTAAMGMSQDVTERAERDRKLERRARQQRVVADLGQRALDADDLDDLMARAAEQVADALDNDYCKVLDLDDEARELLLRQGVGWDDGVVGHATVDADDNSQAGYTLLSEEPVVVDDLADDNRFSGPELLTAHDVASGVSTIIGSPAEPWGILGTHDTSRKQFSEEDVNFVQSVANVLADAIERERYDAEREQLVADLEASNERLEQFAYAASHDLQEPLRMVSSYLSLVADRYGDALDEDGREFLAYAVDGADRMQEMIDALLEYSRVERGDTFEPVSLDDVFADICRDFEVKIEEEAATVVAEPLPTVAGDEDQLRQVLGNLLSNAIEYGGEEPTVRVSAERDGAEWVVAVSDDGIGIDPEHADRIFEVFQRLHTHDEHPGTGVGLALVQRIVERHGGDVRVESTPGEGSTFYFSVPDMGQRDD